MKKFIVIILSLLIAWYYIYNSKEKTYIEGKFFDCNSKIIDNKTISIAIFKDLENIASNTPIKIKVFKNTSKYKISTDDLKINNFFLLAYTGSNNNFISPQKSTLINDWSKSISTLNMYKNLYLCKVNSNTNPYTASKLTKKDALNISPPSIMNQKNFDTKNIPEIKKDENKNPNELYLYKINGTLDKNLFKEICLNNNNIVSVVEVYKDPINDFFPIKKSYYSLKTKAPLSSILMYCNEYNFELSFFTNVEEIYPYLTFKTIDQDSKKIIFKGSAENINGVPITLLSRKKDNTPTILKPKPNLDKDFSRLTISTNKSGLIAEILNLNKIKIKTKLNKAYLSSSDGKIIIDKIPTNSLFTISIIDPENLHVVSFDVFTQFPVHNIKIPDVFNNKTSLTIINGSNFSSISSLSKEPKNKFNLSLKTYYETINNLENEKLFINYRDKDKRTSTEYVNLNNNLIIEPEIQTVYLLEGNISLLDSSNLTPCSNCKVNFFENNTNTYRNGNYKLEFNELLTKPVLEFNINNYYFINTLLPKNLNILKLDIELPSKPYLRYLNSLATTKVNNSIIFGKSTYNVILAGGKTSIKARLLKNGYFYFPDIKTGNYTLFMIKKDGELSHIRNINIKDTGVYVIK